MGLHGLDLAAQLGRIFPGCAGLPASGVAVCLGLGGLLALHLVRLRVLLRGFVGLNQ